MISIAKRFSASEELANALSHFMGALLACGGLVLMVVFSAIRGNAWHVVSTSVFGATMLILYTSSAFNHWLKPGRGKEFFFNFDQVAIFLLIAGTVSQFFAVFFHLIPSKIRYPMNRSFLILLLLFAFTSLANAQNDTIWSRSGDMLVGEIKSLESGILVFDADYADKDFNIEWSEIKQVVSERNFLIILTDGRRLNGSIYSHLDSLPRVNITSPGGVYFTNDLLDITALTPVEKTILGRLDASIEIGYNYAKANNHHQFSTRSNLGYTADIWSASGSLDIIRSAQDSVAPTKRTDGTIGATAFFNRSWFFALSNNFLQSDQQLLKLRSTTNLSVGRLFLNTYRAYWGVGIGSALNYESFTSDDPDERSLEGLIASELNLFAFEDLSLKTYIRVYPGFSVRGRIRSDFKFDLKYDLPLDFFIKLGFTHNFDNKPVEGASTSDYVIQTTFGWEL